MIAIVEAARAGLLARETWGRNLVAGLVVGVVALPLAMAFAMASGVKPEQGIYTSIIAGLAVSLFGGSRIQIAGPTGAFVVILAAIVARHGVDGLLLATLMAGVILILFGAAKFGGVLRYIPDPVIVGFTAGIGVVIWVSQWKDFFGLPAPAGEHFHEKLVHLLQSLPQLHPATTGLAVLSLLLAIYAPRVPGLQRVPGPLVAMVAATILQATIGFEGVATIASAFGGIPQSLPHFVWPALSLDRLVSLVPAAFTIAMLGAIESLLSASVADGMAGTRHDSNQELIGQGIANVISPLFGGIAATGAIARTATSFRNGATNPLAGIVHSVLLLAILLLLAPLAGAVPLAALAAILFLVAWNMSEARHFMRMVRTAPRADVAILLITFVLTVMVDLVIAVNVGVILAMLLFLRRMSNAVEVLRVDERALDAELRGTGRETLPRGVIVYSIEGPFFFGAVESLERVLGRTHTDPRAIVIRLGRVPFMDATGLQAIEEATRNLERRGVRVLYCEARPNVLRKLVRVELVGKQVTPVRYYSDLHEALIAIG
ncbi:MAG: C4-dicarboxylic acid transporter DauA [Steroidobacteraceae bacterium]|nr:C4-dicarboxylic acid transporter DauA [Steroidobacteraceae bacterium]